MPLRPAHRRRRSTCGILALSCLGIAATPAHAQTVDVFESDVPALQAALSSGVVTSVDLVDAYLARIAAYDDAGPRLNSFIRLNPRARDEAAALDAERRSRGARGPLHGIPIVLKDNFDTADMPTSAGSIALAGLIPPVDGFQVRRLREAGAIILGKTNLHELASGITTISSLGGQTRNPYDPARNPGGSSGGTGAAVAASFAALGWGTDTCGSIRIPASFASLFGLRATKGLSSVAGIVPLSHTQDVGGPLARTARDLAIGLDATVGFDSADAATAALRDRPSIRFEESLDEGALRGARLGVLLPYFGETTDERAVTRVVRDALEAMRSAGAVIVDVEAAGLDSLVNGSGVIDHEFKYDLIDYLAGIPNAPVDSLGDILRLGLVHADLSERLHRRNAVLARETAEYRRALERQAALRAALVDMLDSHQVDALVYPTVRREPARIGEPQSGSTCSVSANSGLPALSMPAGFTDSGLPVGIELLGRPFQDTRLVALAFAFETTGPRRRPPPTTPPLAQGRAPTPSRLTVSGEGQGTTFTARVSYDAPRSAFAYEITIRGIPESDALGIVLRRDGTSAQSPASVVHRLAGPARLVSSGELSLSGADHADLAAGRWSIVVYTRSSPTDGIAARLRFGAAREGPSNQRGGP